MDNETVPGNSVVQDGNTGTASLTTPPTRRWKTPQIIGTVIALVIVIGGAAAFHYVRQRGGVSSVGTDLATMLPANSVLVASLDLEDPDARNHLPDLAHKFGTGSAQQRLDDTLGTLMEESTEEGARAEVAALVASTRQVIVAATDENPSILYAIAQLRDAKTYEALEKKLLTLPGYSKDQYKSFTILTKGTEGLFVTHKDATVYASSTKEGLQKLMDGAFAAAPLSGDPDYSVAMQRMGRSFLTAYFRPDFVNKVAEQAAMEGATEEQKQQLAQAAESLKAITAMAFAVKAEKEGLRIAGTTFGNREVLDQMQFKFSSLPSHESYLTSDIPAGPTIMFSEAYDLRSSFANSFRLNGMDPAQLKDLESQLAEVATGMGLDLKADVYPLFAKGSAFALQFDDGNVFPRLTVITDVTGEEQRADKVVTGLTKGLEGAIATLTSPESGIPAGLVAKTTVPIKGKNFTRITFNTAAVSAFVGADAPAALRTALEKLKVELWLGVTDGGRMVMTTTSGLDARLDQDSVQDEDDYADAMGQVTDTGRGIAYFHIANLSQYVGQVYQVLSSYEGGDGFASYAKFIESIKPLRYLILSSSASDYETQSDGFLKIGE